MVYERARQWLEGKSIANREQAEAYLANLGEDSNSNVWASVLDAIFPEAEITSIEEGFILNTISEQQQKEIEQEPDLGFIERAGRLVRRILRGALQQT